MKYITAILMTALAIASGAANMASQTWVEMRLDQTKTLLIKTNEDFVANYVKSVGIANAAISIETNNVNSVTVGQETENQMTVTWQKQTVRALMVTNATDDVRQYGITNRFLFVWDGNESYINGNGEMIVATTNCFKWHGIESFRTNRLERFEGKFDVKGVLIQPAQSAAITNRLTNVSYKLSIFDRFASLFVGSAYANEGEESEDKKIYQPAGFSDSELNPVCNVNLKSGERTFQANWELENGKIKDLEKTLNDLGDDLTGEMVQACYAMQSALQAKAEVKELGDNLEALLFMDGITIPKGDGKNIVVKFKKDDKGKIIIDENGTQIDEEESSGLFHADEKSLQSVEDKDQGNKSDKWQLYGWDKASESDKTIWDVTGIYAAIPERDQVNKDTVLKWYHWVGADGKSVAAEKDKSNNERFGVKGWRTEDPPENSKPLADVLRNTREGDDNKYQVLVRTAKDGELQYRTIGYGIGSGNPDEITVSTNNVDDSSSDLNGKLAIAGFYKQESDITLSDELLKEEEDEDLEYSILVRSKSKQEGVNDAVIKYAKIGSISDMGWSTNWTEAVKNISKEEAKRITDAATNVYFKEENIYNITNIYLNETTINVMTNLYLNEEYITIETNVYHNETFVNFSTNVVIKYGDSITNYYYIIGLPKRTSGGGDPKPDPIAPEDDPYNPGYEHDETWDEVVPVKNALNIVALTNDLFSSANADHATDQKSVWTNKYGMAEIAGFGDVVDDEEYDFYPTRVYDGEPPRVILIRTKSGGYREVEVPAANTVWMTNDMAAIKKALGMSRSPKKSEIETMLEPSNVNNFFTENGIINKVFGITGIVEKINSAIKVETAWDNASVWTNGEAKVEVKGYGYKGNRKSAADVPVRPWEEIEGEKDAPKNLEWKPYVQGDGDVEYSSSPEISIDTKKVEDEDGNDLYAFGIHGFDGSGRKNGSVPFANIQGTADQSREISWADPPDGVSADAPKVLTFDGSTVAWGDAGGGSALKVYGCDGATEDSSAIVIGGGATTNVIRFASATDSNIKVTPTVGSDTDGPCVKITIGVYYK